MRYLVLTALLATPAYADDPVIENVVAKRSGDTWRFEVTVSHPETGWDDYADGWRILDMDGKELGMRVLHHPHENEQPFTRSLSGVAIPDGTSQVQVQPRTNVDGWAKETFVVPLN